MDINKCIKRNDEKKTVVIAIRVTPNMSNWLREKNLSPTSIFFEAIKELGYSAETQTTQ